ncbi:hypothetical protein DL93DRAFT_1325056 [Clavulina sp. PMI_390]|nr:hypothetical protein DL93DRAFT_1325056 [Clavulina sp. PMI_390]
MNGDSSLDMSVIKNATQHQISFKDGMKDAPTTFNNRFIELEHQHTGASDRSPAFKLPAELLGAIFSLACHAPFPTNCRFWRLGCETTHDRVNRTRMSIGLTSVHWRRVLVSTPSAWKNVVFTCPNPSSLGPAAMDSACSSRTRMMRLQLERSKSSRHYIFIDAYNPRSRLVLKHLNQNECLIGDERLQLEALCIRALEPAGAWTSWLFTTPLIPFLRFLHINWEEPYGPRFLDLSGAPRLEALIVSFTWGRDPLSISCPHVQHLSQIRFNGSISIADAFYIIVKSRGTLQELGWECSDTPTSGMFPAPLAPCIFPKLRTLLFDMPDGKTLLDNTVFPVLETLWLGAWGKGYLAKHRFPLLPFLRNHRPDCVSFLEFISENSCIEQMCLSSLAQTTVDRLIPFISPPTNHSDSAISVSTEAAIYDPLPNLRAVYATSGFEVVGIEGLITASRRRHRPFVTVVDDLILKYYISSDKKQELDRLLEIYPDLLRFGPVPPILGGDAE